MRSSSGLAGKSSKKIKAACALTLRHGLEYLWIDTCCIDQDSSAEYSEAINSMYNWYARAAVCFAYLYDVKLPRHPIEESEWFSRGWTLQELIAPRRVQFYDGNWNLLGTKQTLTGLLADVTGVDLDVLLGRRKPSSCSIAQRMSWAAHRETEKIEDEAYCLLGLFEVSIHMNYGEEEKAFNRLQEEIIRHSDDQSIFAWQGGFRNHPDGRCGLLATSPAQFAKCRDVVNTTTTSLEHRRFEVTNIGLSIRVPTIPWTMETFLAILDCSLLGRPDHKLAIVLERVKTSEMEQQDERVPSLLWMLETRFPSATERVGRRITEHQYARVEYKGVSVMIITKAYLDEAPSLEVRRVHVRQTVLRRTLTPWSGFYLRTLNLPGFTKKQMADAEVFTRMADGRFLQTRNRFLRLPDGMVGMVAVLRMPQCAINDPRIAWMQFGFDGDFGPLCRFGRRLSRLPWHVEELFDHEWTRSHSTNPSSFSWRVRKFLSFRGTSTMGLEEEVECLGLEVSITKRQLSHMPPSEQFWTIDVDTLESARELQRKRDDREHQRALATGILASTALVYAGTKAYPLLKASETDN